MKELIVEISRISPFGNGVGYDKDNNVFFVPYSVPGDTVLIRLPNNKNKRYHEAELLKIIKPSTERIEPDCPYFGNCGGCDWLCWNYFNELKGKEKLIEYAFSKSNIRFEKFNPIKPSPEILYYRNRIQLHQYNNKLGFFKRRTHEIVDIESCCLAHPKVNEALSEYRKISVTGKGRIEFVFDGNTVQTIHDSEESLFSQINPPQNEFLKKHISSWIEKEKATKILELYCGSGNLTFSYLNSNIEKILAIDSNPYSINNARQKNNDIIEFINAEINKTTIKKISPQIRNSYDTLILDPPRSGVIGNLVHFIHPRLERVIYVSCNILSFIKDIQCLKKDFVFKELQPIDMFPRCRHVEVVGFFSR